MVRISDHALDVRVRPARIPDDLDEICALYTQEAEFHAAQWPADFRKRDVTSSVRKEFAQAGDNRHLLLIVAEVGGGTLGGVLSAYLRPKPEQGVSRHDGPTAYVADVVVTSELRRRGIGTLLMRRAEHWARDRGAVTITLNVHSGNSAALALYEQEGFRRTQITMRRDLT